MTRLNKTYLFDKSIPRTAQTIRNSVAAYIVLLLIDLSMHYWVDKRDSTRLDSTLRPEQLLFTWSCSISERNIVYGIHNARWCGRMTFHKEQSLFCYFEHLFVNKRQCTEIFERNFDRIVKYLYLFIYYCTQMEKHLSYKEITRTMASLTQTWVIFHLITLEWIEDSEEC